MSEVAFFSVSPHYATDTHPIVKAAHPEGLVAVYGDDTFERVAQAGRYFFTAGRGDNPTDVRYAAVHRAVDRARFPLGVVAEYEMRPDGRVREVQE